MVRQRPVAYFDMNAIRGVPLNRVHNMLQEVVRRVGRERCGLIDITYPADDGRYFLTFYNRDAADLFERLHHQTGRTPRRLSRLPDNVTILGMEEAVTVLVLHSLEGFMRHMRSHLN